MRESIITNNRNKSVEKACNVLPNITVLTISVGKKKKNEPKRAPIEEEKNKND